VKILTSLGAVMRTSITGIPQFHNLDTVINNTKAFAKVTHADPRCIASCVAVTVTIALVLQEKYDPNDKEQLVKLVDEAYSYAAKELETEDQKKELETCIVILCNYAYRNRYEEPNLGSIEFG
jgi:ADP-ribosylglycohydrolase